jgi:hypothetical protein
VSQEQPLGLRSIESIAVMKPSGDLSCRDLQRQEPITGWWGSVVSRTSEHESFLDQVRPGNQAAVPAMRTSSAINSS